MNILIENLFKSKDLNFKLSEDVLFAIAVMSMMCFLIIFPETIDAAQALFAEITENTVYTYKHLMNISMISLSYYYGKEWFDKDGLKIAIFAYSMMTYGEFLFEQHTIL